MDTCLKDNPILKIPLVALNLTGLVQFKDQKCQLLNKIWGYSIVIIYIFFNISQLIFLYVNNFEVNLIFNHGSATSLYFTIWVKALVSIIYRKEYNLLYNKINKTIKNLYQEGDQETKNILDDLVKKSTRAAVMMLVLVGFTGSVVVIYLIYLSFIAYVLVYFNYF